MIESLAANDIPKAKRDWNKDVKIYAIKAFEDACGKYHKKDIGKYVKSLLKLKWRLLYDQNKKSDTGSTKVKK